MKQVRTLKNEVLMRSSHKLKFKRRKCIYTIKQRLINLNLKYLVIQIKLEYLKSILHSRSSLLPSYCTSHQNTLTFCLETAFQSRTQQLATSVLDTFLIFLSVCLLGGGLDRSRTSLSTRPQQYCCPVAVLRCVLSRSCFYLFFPVSRYILFFLSPMLWFPSILSLVFLLRSSSLIFLFLLVFLVACYATLQPALSVGPSHFTFCFFAIFGLTAPAQMIE